jgi:glycosyltransferase involved in cell wall biosynthesis
LRTQFGGAGVEVGSAPVIYHGVRVADFCGGDDRNGRNGILYAGRVSPEKGVDVLLDALTLLKDDPVLPGRRITVAGARPHPEYWDLIQSKAKELRRVTRLELRGQIPRARMPELLRSHSVYVLPAVWDEPFSIGLLEAMAAGLAVIATNTGGSSEILRDGENCLVVPKGDPPALAAAIRRVLSDDHLRDRIARGGREAVEQFDLDHSIQRIGEHLDRALSC